MYPKTPSQFKFSKAISKNGIYKSDLPDFDTLQFFNKDFVSSSIFEAPTYGGFPTIISKPLLFFILTILFQSKLKALS